MLITVICFLFLVLQHSRPQQPSPRTGGHVAASGPSSSSDARSERRRDQPPVAADELAHHGYDCGQRSRPSGHPSHQRRESTNAAVQRVPESPRMQRSHNLQHAHQVALADVKVGPDMRRFYGAESPFDDQRLSPYLGHDPSDESPLHSPPHLQQHPVFFARQEGYPLATYDNPADYFGDLRFQDVSQIAAVPATPRPKPRAFPRTNPAYIGTRRQDGGQSYRKICQELQSSPTVVYNQQFFDVHSQAPGPAAGRMQQMSQSYLSEAVDRRKMFRHERSDSDTSHSSFGIGRLQQDVVESQTARQQCPRDQFSDSQSSEGSLRGGIHGAHSSQGSLRCAGHEKEYLNAKLSPHDSLCSYSSFQHGADFASQIAGYQQLEQYHHHQKHDYEKQAQSAQSTPMIRIRARRNSEPDYANLPIITQLRAEKGVRTDDDKRPEGIQLQAGTVANDEPRSGDSLPSADSLSPTEFCKRHDTPSSVRSSSTQNSEGLPDQGYDDSDNSSLFSSPSPKTRQRHMAFSLSLQQSVRERKMEKGEPGVSEKGQVTEGDLVQSLALLLSHSEEDLAEDSTPSDLAQRQVTVKLPVCL